MEQNKTGHEISWKLPGVSRLSEKVTASQKDKTIPKAQNTSLKYVWIQDIFESGYLMSKWKSNDNDPLRSVSNL